jgi:preprotein translocase subunit SecD
MKNKKFILWGIILLVVAASFVVWKKPTSLGLDLVGGSRIVLEAQTTDTIAKITQDMMDGLKFAIEKRVNALGVSETQVQQMSETRLLIEIPNIKDPKLAREFLGDTAELEFKRPVMSEDNVLDWESTDLTGKDLKKAQVSTDQAGSWVVSLEFNDEGGRKFSTLTKELVGKPMAIFFNGELMSSPNVNEQITGGHAQISGSFTYDEAKKMVDVLNAGALPVPAKIVEESMVSSTLGADS